MLNHSASGLESSTYFIERKPPAALAKYVDKFWICRSDVRANGKDQMLPTGTASLIINLMEDQIRVYDSNSLELIQREEGASFGGVYRRPFVIDTAEQVFVAGVSFHPGGAWPFMKCAQDELSGSLIPLRDIWGLDIAYLRERLLVAPTPMASLAVLESTLLNQLQRPLEQHKAVTMTLAAIQHDPSGTRIAQLSERGSISTRRITRLFEQQVGLTPKLYARMVRFRRALRLAWQDKIQNWAQLAFDCGYADQPHFTREFKSFSGLTPTQFVALKSEFENHVPIE